MYLLQFKLAFPTFSKREARKKGSTRFLPVIVSQFKSRWRHLAQKRLVKAFCMDIIISLFQV